MSPRKPVVPPSLHTILPPLILGTATFNYQFVSDPQSLPSQRIVSRALVLNINAFDASRYYGPCETILGNALSTLYYPALPLPPRYQSRPHHRRIFDYSPEYARYSILPSLRRLRTPYIDLVYAHDVEFVSPAEVLTAVRELRRLPDEDGLVRYIGISGYPVRKLCELAEVVHRETGEGLDAVLSYGHFTLKNRELGLPELDGAWEIEGSVLKRLKKAGVNVFLNASMLGMGLLTSVGIPLSTETQVEVARTGADGKAETESRISPLAKWHPSSPGLRVACRKLAGLTSAAGERLEAVAIRWSLEEWARIGAAAGLGVAFKLPGASGTSRPIGTSVMGVSSVAELEETVAEGQGVLAGLWQGETSSGESREYRTERQRKIMELVEKQMWPALGEWKDYGWASPGKAFVNTRKPELKGLVPQDDGRKEGYDAAKKRANEGASAS